MFSFDSLNLIPVINSSFEIWPGQKEATVITRKNVSVLEHWYQVL